MKQLIYQKGMYSLVMTDDGIIEWLCGYYEHDLKKASDDVMSFLSALDKLFSSERQKKYSILVDVRPVYNQAFHIPDVGKQAFTDILKHEQTKRVAVLGANTWLTRMTEIMVSMTQEWNKLRFFKDEQKARQWLLMDIKK